MNTCPLWRRAFACAFFLPILAAQAQVVFQNGFESYAAGSAIQGQPVGTGAWTTLGVQPGDIAQVSATLCAEGVRSLLIADNGANRPRASVDLVTSGYVTAAIASGSASVEICEDPYDGSLPDCFILNFGAISIQRGTANSLWFTVTGGGGSTVPFAGTGYTYTPGNWNVLKVEFNDATKTAKLFINGGIAATITGPSANFTVGLVTLGTYASTPTGDALYFDELEVRKPTTTTTTTVAALVQGQSNAVDMLTNAAWFGGDAGYQSIFKGLVRDLTGVPNVILYGNEKAYDVGRRTAVGGTYLFKTGLTTGVWMDSSGPNAATWPLLDIGLECDNYIRTTIRGNMGAAPLAFLRIHSEYDGRHTTDAVYYAAANRNFVAKMRDAAGLTASQMPLFYGQIPYAGPAAQGNDALRGAWAADIANPAMNARYAWGAANDGPYLTDGVHMGIEACRQAHARMAFAYARWLYDNGYANTDLSTLPTTGPRLASFRRGPAANQIDVTIQHDKGTDFVIPAGVNLGAFSVSDPGVSPAPVATSAARVNATTLRLTLDKNLSASTAIKLDYLGYAPSPYANKNVMYGTGTLITDNYHLLTKPSHITLAIQNNYSATSTPPAPGPLTMTLCRLPAPLTLSP